MSRKFLIIGITGLFGPALYGMIKDSYPDSEIITTSFPGEKLPVRGKYTGAYDVDPEHNHELDVLDRQSVAEFIADVMPDIVYDLAVQNSVGLAWENPQSTIDVNVNGTLNILDAVRDSGKKMRVIIAGSGEEYGELPFSQIPMSEDVKVNPRNIFAASKACQTMMARLYVKAYKMDVIVLRTFNEIGPGQSDRFAVSNFCHQFVKIKRGEAKPEIVTGNVNIMRDFTDFRDLAQAFLLLAEKGKSGEVYNAGRGNAVPISEVLRTLTEITGTQVTIVADAARIRPIDSAVFESDNSRIYADVGWKPARNLTTTLTDMLNYWKQY